MIAHGKEIKVFCGNSNPAFAQGVCDELGLTLGRSEVKKFADGEVSVSVNETVRGCDVFVVQSTCNPVNDNLMELLIMMDAFRRASAGRITAVMPYFGYARQDRKAKGRDPISAKLVANMIVAAGADRVLTMDLHAAQIQGFFDIPVDNMLGSPVFVKYYMEKFNEEQYDHNNFVVDTAGSLCNAAAALVEVGGAEKVYACASHGVLSGPALERVESSYIEELMVLNTIPMPAGYTGGKIKQLDVAPLFAKAINRVYTETSISSLF